MQTFKYLVIRLVLWYMGYNFNKFLWTFNEYKIMAVTRLQRKVKRKVINVTKAQNRLQQLLRKPVIKNVDIEAIKASFVKQQ